MTVRTKSFLSLSVLHVGKLSVKNKNKTFSNHFHLITTSLVFKVCAWEMYCIPSPMLSPQWSQVNIFYHLSNKSITMQNKCWQPSHTCYTRLQVQHMQERKDIKTERYGGREGGSMIVNDRTSQVEIKWWKQIIHLRDKVMGWERKNIWEIKREMLW